MGRFFLAALATAGLISFIDDNAAFTFLTAVTALAALANLGLMAVLIRGRVQRVFFAGLLLDLAIVLAVWTGATWLLGDSGRLNDVHLAPLPILAATAVWLGWPLGVAQSIIFAGWLVGANLILLDPGTYVASQTPVQALLIITSAALTIWLLARMRIERERSESQWLESEVLADLSRVLGSATDFDAVYGQTANSIRRLISFDRMSLLTIDGERGSTSLRYIDGINDLTSTDDRIYEIKLASFAADTGRPVRVSRASIPSAGPDNDEGMFGSSIAAPVQHDGRVIGVLSLHAQQADKYRVEHERIIGRIADQISGILARDITYAHEVDLVEHHLTLEMENDELGKLGHERAEFAAAVAHVFKTPLATMMAYTEVLKTQREGELNKAQLAHLATIWSGGKSLLALLDDLLAITRFSAGVMTVEPDEFDFHELCDEIAEKFAASTADRDQTFEVIVPEGPIPVVADRTRLSQALSNLLHNACNFSPKGSKVTFTVSVEGDRVGVAVQDQGVGIPYEDQRDLFEPFYRVDNEITRSNSGSGLGLALALAVMEEHGGDITLDSTPGEGSTFWVSLPVLNQDKAGLSQDRAA
jgi:signal transduction histidine kinase